MSKSKAENRLMRNLLRWARENDKVDFGILHNFGTKRTLWVHTLLFWLKLCNVKIVIVCVEVPAKSCFGKTKLIKL